MHRTATFQSIAGTMSDGVVSISQTGLIVSVNPAMTDIFGYDPDELVGQNITLLMPDHIAEDHQTYLDRTTVNEKGRSLAAGRDLTGQHKDGTMIPVSISVFSLQNDNAEQQFLGLISDLSSRAALKRERDKTRLLYKNIDLLEGVGMWRIDVASGALEWSDQIYELHGLSPDRFTPTIEASLSHFHPDDAEEVRTCVTRAMTTGADFEFRAKLVRADCDIRHVWSIGRAEFNAEGKPIAIFGNIVDLTREKKREAALTAINAQQNILNNILYEHSLATSPEAFFDNALQSIVRYPWTSLDNRGALFVRSPLDSKMECRTSVGLDETELTDIAAFTSGDARYNILNGFQVYEIARHTDILGYLVLAERDGIPLSRNDAMFAASGIEVLAICLDDLRKQATISAQNTELRARLTKVQELSTGFEKQAKALAKLSSDLEREKENAEAANRSKSAFLANMSHEVRTPLNGVLGMLSMLEMSTIKGDERECVTLAKEATYSALQLINDILDLSHLEAGKLTIINHEFNFDTLAKRIMAMVRGKAETKGLEFTIVNELGSEPLIGDDLRIQQIIINLADNAIKFTDCGYVQVHIDRDHKANRVRIEVKDTGTGMTADQTARMFERFEQADPSNTRRHGGVGLGLAICRNLVEEMAGSISVTSEPGKGTRFIVEIPLGAANTHAAESEAARAEGNFCQDCRILAAEDNRVNQEILKRLARMLELDITIVSDGAQAVAKVETGGYDIILMDIQMPVMDGIEATRKLRTQGYTLPIIAVSAHAMTGDRERFMEAGFNGYVAKPYEVVQLLTEIERLTEGSGEEEHAATM